MKREIFRKGVFMDRKVIIGTALIMGILAIGAVVYQTPSKDKNPVRIGVVLPLSGEYEAYGRMGLQGARMAVAEINISGGVLDGRALELVVEDNQTDPNLAVRQTRKLILEDEVTAVLGPVSSSTRNAMTAVARELKTPLLYGIDYEGGMFDRYLFCYSLVPDHIIKPLIPYFVENYGSKFYVFGYDYIRPHKMAETIKREVTAIGGQVVGIEFSRFGVDNFSSTIDRIKASKADNLILIMPGPDGYAFIRQFNASGLKDAVKVAAIAADEAYLKALLPRELEGILSPLQFLSSLDREEAKSFVDRQKKMFGKETIVTYSTESHYGLIRLFAAAMEKAGNPDKEAIIDAMENLNIVVGNGTVTMRHDHHMILNIVIAEFQAGNLVLKEDIGRIVPAEQK